MIYHKKWNIINASHICLVEVWYLLYNLKCIIFKIAQLLTVAVFIAEGPLWFNSMFPFLANLKREKEKWDNAHYYGISDFHAICLQKKFMCDFFFYIYLLLNLPSL